ncbi:MAG: AAA family ATPase [Xenococcaceae cyanobacterium MO_167.B27]|nr:AAA family ATPase [Xenococcaceae cyanobacterium MO_167.B27]
MNYMLKSPYKGLIAYSEEDRLFFFGREQDREKITDELKARRLTVLYGASGVGKSSVLRAGVAYHLRQAAKKNVDTTGKPGWAIIVFPPVKGKLAKEISWQKPLAGIKEQLKAEIVELLGVSETKIDQQFKAEIAGLFPDLPSPPENQSLLNTLKAWANIIRDEDGSSRLFIILDQFEEYLVQLQKKSNDNAFLDEFQKAINSSEVSVNFLISIREDSLASLDRLVNIQDRFKNLLAIKHLNEQSAREAIKMPIFEYNRQKIILEKFLDNSRLTILTGNRDTYKSTVLRSAIVPYLQKNINVIFFNHWRKSQEHNLLDIFILKISQELNPLDNLSSSQSELTLADTLNTWSKHIGNKQDETRIFVILDQFEEYFKKLPKLDPEQKFINELLSIINDNSLKIKFLISIRDRWFPALETYQDRFPDSCQYYLHLNAKGKNLIEEKPIDPNKVTPDKEKELQQKLQAQFIRIEPNLDDYILEEFKQKAHERNRSNSDTTDIKSDNKTELEVEAPYLQLVMTRLWDEERASSSKCLRRETFTKKLCGVKGIVNDHFIRQISRLSNEEQDIAARIFSHLVTQSGIKIALPVKDLLDYANTNQKPILKQKPIEDLLNKLSDISKSREEEENYRILRSVPGIKGERRYEIFHDMLAQPILDWESQYIKTREQKRVKATQKAKWLFIGGGGVTLVVMILGAIGLIVVTTKNGIFQVQNEVLKATTNFFQYSQKASPSIDSRNIDTLFNMMQAGERLQKLQNDWLQKRFIDKDEYNNDINKLEETLKPSLNASIQEQNQLEVQIQDKKVALKNVNFSLDQGKNRFAVVLEDGTIHLGNFQNQTLGEPIAVKNPVSISLSPDGSRLATAAGDSTIDLWDTKKGKKVDNNLPGKIESVLSLSFIRTLAKVFRGIIRDFVIFALGGFATQVGFNSTT